MLQQAIGVLTRYLVKDSDLFLLVGGRIYPGEIAEIKNPQYPCITFKSVGGWGDKSINEFKEPTINFWVYSKNTFDECRKIYDTLTTKLHNQLIEDATIKIVRPREIMLPIDTFDPDGRLYKITGRWVLNVFKQV